jgi:hypothetical protein
MVDEVADISEVDICPGNTKEEAGAEDILAII